MGNINVTQVPTQIVSDGGDNKKARATQVSAQIVYKAANARVTQVSVLILVKRGAQRPIITFIN